MDQGGTRPGREYDAPRSELDQVLAPPVSPAVDVLVAQNRLRGLLAANQSIVGDLALGTVLRRVVEAARELVGAKYGALGVIAPDGTGLEQFIHVGLEPDEVAAIGQLPEGKGLLGALIDDPKPIRLREISEDSRSVGFPENHPPMRGFIGVPIRVRDKVFGNLYLAGISKGEFSEEDEELVSSLAASAGIAIENARLFEVARHRQEWLQASTDVTRELMQPEPENSLRVIAQYLHDLADADIVTVAVPSADGKELRLSVAVGETADQLTDTSYPMENTFSQLVLKTGEAMLIENLEPAYAAGGRVIHLSSQVDVGAVMVLPLMTSSGPRGSLVAGRLRGRRGFTQEDLSMAATFANHASLALELADARRDQQRVVLLEDRARIARDLHDHVIQQLFAAGMTVQGVSAGLAGRPDSDLLEKVVDHIDEAIRQIRTSIFQLRPHALSGSSIRAAVLSVVAEITPSLGFDPKIRFDGPVDAVSDDALAEDVIAVVRELLSNVAKHAHASTADLAMHANTSVFTVTIVDDGRGVGEAARSSGLDNLRERAEARAGRFSVEPGPAGSGTAATWTVPLS